MASSVPPIEIGSLSSVSPNESSFIGSSSGIFFVNTVHRAFAIGKASSPQHGAGSEPHDPPSIDNLFVGDESEESSQENDPTRIPPNALPTLQHSESYGINPRPLGLPPSREVARELIMSYFRVWHPLFPFIHGPSFLRDVDAFYSGEEPLTHGKTNTRRNNCRAIVFQCVFNIAALDRPDLRLPPESSIESATGLLSCLSTLISRHDIYALQALMAGQIYLIATMSLHAASTIGGMLMRLIFHAGFHRCPYRYIQLSSHDCDMRKRIFWSAYAVDRYLSQALGLPLGIQDSDIDVCLPGTEELHRASFRTDNAAITPATIDVASHLPKGHPDTVREQSAEQDDRREASPVAIAEMSNPSRRPTLVAGQSQAERHGDEALANYVAYGRLTGRALEMFHKSITVRSVDYSHILALTSDIHSFWNNLPPQLENLPSKKNQASHTDAGLTEGGSSLSLFFAVIYQQLILLINRPFLSLDPNAPEFRSSLQTCIAAGRVIISSLREQTEGGYCISWPGILSGTWMSGLILAFACAQGLYPLKKGLIEIEMCLELLNTMSEKWATAKHCHSALRVLLDGLQPEFGRNSISIAHPANQRHQLFQNSSRRREDGQNLDDNRGSKRQRMGNTEDGPDFGDQSQPDFQPPPFMENTGDFASVNSVLMQGYNQFTDAQWMQAQAFDTVPPYTEDIFGHLSWESLFQDDSLQGGVPFNNFPLMRSS